MLKVDDLLVLKDIEIIPIDIEKYKNIIENSNSNFRS